MATPRSGPDGASSSRTSTSDFGMIACSTVSVDSWDTIQTQKWAQNALARSPPKGLSGGLEMPDALKTAPTGPLPAFVRKLYSPCVRCVIDPGPDARPGCLNAMATLNSSPPPLLSPEAFGYWRSFSRNILDFLETRGTEVQLPNLPSIRCWFVALDDGTRLHVYAETIVPGNSSCDQCRIIGTSFPHLHSFLRPKPIS